MFCHVTVNRWFFFTIFCCLILLPFPFLKLCSIAWVFLMIQCERINEQVLLKKICELSTRPLPPEPVIELTVLPKVQPEHLVIPESWADLDLMLAEGMAYRSLAVQIERGCDRKHPCWSFQRLMIENKYLRELNRKFSQGVTTEICLVKEEVKSSISHVKKMRTFVLDRVSDMEKLLAKFCEQLSKDHAEYKAKNDEFNKLLLATVVRMEIKLDPAPIWENYMKNLRHTEELIIQLKNGVVQFFKNDAILSKAGTLWEVPEEPSSGIYKLPVERMESSVMYSIMH